MVLAAALLEIKSKMLLPRSVKEDGTVAMPEDPRTELVEKLVEYKKYKTLAEMLEAKFDETSMSLEKPQEDLSQYTGEPDEYLSLDVEKFKNAFEQFLTRKKRIEEIKAHHKRTKKQRITTEIRMENIKNFFRDNGLEEADFRELIEKRDDKYDVAVTFSSVLEMMKEKRLDAEQKYIFGDITVRATENLYGDKYSVGAEDETTEQKETADGQ
jgi:segregation and condensation protein A